MQQLFEILGQNNISKYIIILDNASIHLTNELFQFYHTNKFKVLFGVPYMSSFNMIEYTFRYIKNFMYKKLYSNIKLMKEDLINIINDENINKTLPRLYKETLNKYLFYLDNNKYINLNS